MNKEEIKALAKEADAAVSVLEVIAEKLQTIKDELESNRDSAREKMQALTEKRDAAQEKFDALSDTAAGGPRGTKLQETIEKYQDALDAENEDTGLTIEALVDGFDSEADKLAFLDDFDAADARTFADGVDSFADDCDENLIGAEVSEED